MLLSECDREMALQAKQAHTATASYAGRWGKTQKNKVWKWNSHVIFICLHFNIHLNGPALGRK